MHGLDAEPGDWASFSFWLIPKLCEPPVRHWPGLETQDASENWAALSGHSRAEVIPHQGFILCQSTVDQSLQSTFDGITQT